MSIQHFYSQTVADGTATSVVRLREFLSYSPGTGEVRWLVKRTRNNTANVGDLAGSMDSNGYLRVMLDGKKLRIHRLAFMFMDQPIPEQVDHINGDRSDNRWENLRPSSAQRNPKNACRRKDSQTAVTGVTFSKQHSKWKVRVNHSGVTEYLGLFSSLFDAAAARISKQNAYEYSDRHGRVMA